MYSICFFIVCFIGFNYKTDQNLVLGFNWPPSEHVEKLLTFYTPPLPTRILNNTGNSVEITANPKTKEIMTGGILGDEKYRFCKGRYYWEKRNNKTSLKAKFDFHNTKYQSFQEALKHPDGVAQLYISVGTNGCTYNPAFKEFEGTFRKHIKKPGDHALFNSFLSHQGYDDNCDYNSVYKSYYESLHDEVTGKMVPHSLVIECSEKSGKNFMSTKQYADTFRSLMDCTGQILENPPPRPKNHLSSVVESKGMCVVFV